MATLLLPLLTGGIAPAISAGGNPVTLPNLERSTYFGSSRVDAIHDVESDAGGNLIVAGRTLMSLPTDFPLLNAYQSSDDPRLFAGLNAFVAKFGPGGQLIFSTYLGGENTDTAEAVAVDRTGHSYVTGFTQSHIQHGGFALAEFNGFPTTPGAYLTNGSVRFEHCAFLTKFSPEGGVVYSTLITRDGMAGTTGQSVSVDARGNAYVAGNLASAPMAMPGAGTVLFNGAFLMKFNAQGSATVYTNLIPNARGWDVAVEPDGTAHFVGSYSTDRFPVTPDAYQVPAQGRGGAFYQKLSPDGAVLYSSAFAPLQGSSAMAVVADAEGRALVAGRVGEVFGELFPGHFRPVRPIQPGYGGGSSDGFLARFDTRFPGSNSVDFATFLGGTGSDDVVDLALDATGRVLLTGNTSSTEWRGIPGERTRLAGPRAAFALELNAAATGIESLSYLGGSGWDTARGITALPAAGFALAGETESRDFPTTNAFQAGFRGTEPEGFLARYTAAVAAETLVVNSMNDLDDGVCDTAHCSLREAINAANAQPGSQTITFNIPPGQTTLLSVRHAEPVWAPRIQLTNGLPPITGPVTIDGSSQPGGGWITLDGANAGPATNGLTLDTTDCVVRGLSIHGFSRDGIHVLEGGGHRLMDLRIGTDTTGMKALTNRGAGIRIVSSIRNSITSSSDPARTTIIAANAAEGIRIEGGSSVSNRIDHCRVGVNARGEALGNGVAGIYLVNAHFAEVTRCLVAGNHEAGIRLLGLEGAVLAGNTIGSDSAADLTTGARNGSYGVVLFDCVNVLVGGESPNIIAGNYTAEVLVERGASNRFEGNLLGTRSTHDLLAATGVRIVDSTGNRIGGETSIPGARPGNRFEGNLVGIRVSGSNAAGNMILGNLFTGSYAPEAGLEDPGHDILCSAPETVIGGVAPGSGNLFYGSHRRSAILLVGSDARDSSVVGNEMISDDASGTGLTPAGVELLDTERIALGGRTARPGGAPGNIIRGFRSGLLLDRAVATTIEGNLIGVLKDGRTPSPNFNGIVVLGSGATQIGGDTSGAANVISGNLGHGVLIDGGSRSDISEANRICGNFIGVAADGILPIPNGGDGVHLGPGADRTLVGVSPNQDRGGRANIIAHNKGNGVTMDRSTGVPSRLEPRNLVSRNSIFANGGLGIRSSAHTVHPAGSLSVMQLLPAFAAGNETPLALARVEGLRHGGAYRIEFYDNDACDEGGSGEGQRFVVDHEFRAPGQGVFLLPVPVPEFLANRVVTALLFDERNNTSQFSACLRVGGLLADADGDSIPDDVEDLSPQGADGNQDGTADKGQPHVAATRTPGDPAPIILVGPPGGVFSEVRSPNLPPGAETLPPGAQLPNGYHGFKFTHPTPPRRQAPPPVPVVIEVVLPAGSLPDGWFAYGATPDQPEPHWHDFRYDGSTGALISGNIVRLHFLDGERGDEDQTVNGVIVTAGAAVRLGRAEIRITQILPATDGRFWVEGSASAGAGLILESSVDLSSWQPGASTTAPFGSFGFHVPGSSQHRFLRVRTR